MMTQRLCRSDEMIPSASSVSMLLTVFGGFPSAFRLSTFAFAASVSEPHGSPSQLARHHPAHRQHARDRFQHLALRHAVVVGTQDVLRREVYFAAGAERGDRD